MATFLKKEEPKEEDDEEEVKPAEEDAPEVIEADLAKTPGMPTHL